MPLPKAILFDLDDTILAYAQGANELWNSLFATHASQLGTTPEQLSEAFDAYRDWYWGDPARHRRGRLQLKMARREVVVGALHALGITNDEVAFLMADAFTETRERVIEPFPGAIETLRELREAGVRLGLVTNGERDTQRRKIERFGLGDYFGVTVIEGEFGCGKPDERVFCHALDTLHTKPTDAWMVGDNLEWEIEPTQKLGIFAIWNDWQGRGLPAETTIQPDRTIQSLPELLEETPHPPLVGGGLGRGL